MDASDAFVRAGSTAAAAPARPPAGPPSASASAPETTGSPPVPPVPPDPTVPTKLSATPQTLPQTLPQTPTTPAPATGVTPSASAAPGAAFPRRRASDPYEASLDRQLAAMQQSVKSHGTGPSLLVITAVLAALAYAAYRFNLIPKSVLRAVGFAGGDAADDAADATADAAGGPATETRRRDGTPVTGDVVFASAPAEAAKAGCNWFVASKIPESNRIEQDNCKARVDPCKLVGKALNAAPVCHSVKSLCAQKLVPSQEIGSNDMCMLEERGATDSAGTNRMSSIHVPTGITLDVNGGSACQKASTYSKTCRSLSGCLWNSSDYSSDPGLQFGIAPGYQLTCGGSTLYGPTPDA